ncbi:GbsR/MarR family transcriptional regulator [Pseudonocardia humida]|uniref:Transcriptional regulator n=1 Tax=Pseudonocardia humida TaxID=2800819 RepID=A0ABT1AD94_9PSEU|nr:transcriptional regulator [Pseudonocardia humida]MCO1661012.1 transcriptional regulator [Pseudonocardia humida]
MTGPGPTPEQERAWVERVAGFFARQNGLPPIPGRALGRLMICDPPEQSAAELAAAIGASRASLTTALQVLLAGGFVEPGHRPGERTTYYRLADDPWTEVTRRRMAALTSFLAVTGEGLDLLGADSARATRIRRAHELFGWLDSEVGPMWQRWDARREHRDG